MPWKLVVTNNNNSEIRTSEIGYTKRQNTTSTANTINVLQIIPNNSVNCTWNLATDTTFQNLFDKVKDFNVKISTITVGQYEAQYSANATYLEVAIITLISNARYLLMSCALTQRFAPGTPFFHRLIIAYDVTDELFGITIARPGYLNPFYTYGAIVLAAPAWSVGTALGIMAGNVLPVRVVSALSVTLYGMFLAIIIPPARKDKVVAALVAISFVLSFAGSYLPVVSSMSSGTRTIILTVVISSAAAILFPRETEA